MAKGVQKSNREKKKPKQDKNKGKSAAPASTFAAPSKAGKPAGKK